MGKDIIEIMGKIPEPRRGNGIRHKLTDVIIIGIMSIICGYDEYTEMELFGEMKEEWLSGSRHINYFFADSTFSYANKPDYYAICVNPITPLAP